MKFVTSRRSILRWATLMTGLATLTACHATWHVPPGQIRRQTTPAATGTAPGQAKKK